MNGRPGAAFNLQQSEISIYHRGNDVREAGREGRRVPSQLELMSGILRRGADPRGCSRPPAPPRLSPPLHASAGLAAPGSAAFVLMPARFARGNEMILPRQTRRPSKPPNPVPTAAVGASDASCRRHRKQLERVVIQGEALLKNTFNEAS